MMSDPFPFPSDQVEDYAQGDFSTPASIAQQNLQFVLNEHFEDNEQLEENDIPKENDGDIPDAEQNILLWPVLPGESGEGLPYAPIDFPDPGDCWTWRVGKRFSSATGYFQDRFLYLPKRLGKQCFASKPAVINYIKSHFPEADADAFFASFSWKVPVKIESSTKVEPAPPQDEKVVGQEEIKEDNLYSSGRKRRAASTPKETTQNEATSPTPKRAKQSRAKSSSTPKQTKQSGAKSTPRPNRTRQNEATLSTAPKRKTRQTSKQSAPENGAFITEEPTVEPIPEDFDNYLSSLETILTQPVSETQSPSATATGSVLAVNEMAEARSRLSSLLVMDFPSLISSMSISELTHLASKLRNDPRLNAEQIVKLKLIEEIPTFSEVFLESRELIEQVNEFFATLEDKKNKVASLKNEYNELKEKADQLQLQVDSNSLAVQEIDNQIALLQSRRAEHTNSIETNKAAKNEVTHGQKMVASAIPKVVQQIQLANAKMPELELKKRNAEKREGEILAKFAPLQGFCL